MRVYHKISSKCGKKILAVFSLAILFLYGSFFSVSAANEKVVSATVDSENIYLYVKGVSDITGTSVQIGNVVCENVAVDSLDAFAAPLRTVILIDNSNSIKTDKHSDIQGILKSIVDGRMEGEQFRVGTFSDSVTWLCDYSTDYVAVQSILNTLEYVSQQTYFSDCLYSVIQELSDASEATYTRIIIVSDGADNQSIGYTNQEVSDLLGKGSIPVYTIGTEGDNSALETMFSFSRASKAEYFLLDGSISNADIVTSLLADHQIFCIRITPDTALLDGSQKGIKATLQTSAGEVAVTASVTMPFGSGLPAVEATQEPQEEPASEPQEESASESASESGSASVLDSESTPASSLPVLGGNETPAETDAEEEGGLLDNLLGGALADVPVFVFIIAGTVLLFIILMIIIMLIVAGRKKAHKKAEAAAVAQREAGQHQMQQAQQGTGSMGNSGQAQGGSVVDKTMILGGGNTNGNNTISLWDQVQAGQSVTTYLVLRDNARPVSMFKVPIKDVIRIGRKDADIVIDYDKYISSKQCEIIKRGALLYIKDLGSSNGTYYENVRVYDQETPIVSGGMIQIGQSKFTITIVTE